MSISRYPRHFCLAGVFVELRVDGGLSKAFVFIIIHFGDYLSFSFLLFVASLFYTEGSMYNVVQYEDAVHSLAELRI